MDIIFANIDFRIRHTLIVLKSHVAKLYPNMPSKQLSMASSFCIQPVYCVRSFHLMTFLICMGGILNLQQPRGERLFASLMSKLMSNLNNSVQIIDRVMTLTLKLILVIVDFMISVTKSGFD